MPAIEAVLVETIVRPGGFVATAHVHPHQRERFEVLDGQLGLQVGSERLQPGPARSRLSSWGPRTDPVAVERLVERALESYARIDVAFNNAGQGAPAYAARRAPSRISTGPDGERSRRARSRASRRRRRSRRSRRNPPQPARRSPPGHRRAARADRPLPPGETLGELGQLLANFFASPEDERWRGDNHAEDVVGTAIDFGAGYNHGGPLRWSPVVVAIFMTSWLARKVAREPAFFTRVPDVLPDWVRYAGHVRGVPAEPCPRLSEGSRSSGRRCSRPSTTRRLGVRQSCQRERLVAPRTAGSVWWMRWRRRTREQSD
jgi:hypothetical protein